MQDNKGEVRGNHRNGYKGNAGSESMDHFHGGLDIQADRGSVVLAIADGKVSSVLASRGWVNWRKD